TTPILGISGRPPPAPERRAPPREPRRNRALRIGTPPGSEEGVLYGGGGADDAGIGMSSSSSISGVGVGAGGAGGAGDSSASAGSSSAPILPTACLRRPNASPNEKPDFAAGAAGGDASGCSGSPDSDASRPRPLPRPPRRARGRSEEGDGDGGAGVASLMAASVGCAGAPSTCGPNAISY